jgi:hypothetical protein
MIGGFFLTSLLSDCLREMRLCCQAQPCLEKGVSDAVNRAGSYIALPFRFPFPAQVRRALESGAGWLSPNQELFNKAKGDKLYEVSQKAIPNARNLSTGLYRSLGI